MSITNRGRQRDDPWIRLLEILADRIAAKLLKRQKTASTLVDETPTTLKLRRKK